MQVCGAVVRNTGGLTRLAQLGSLCLFDCRLAAGEAPGGVHILGLQQLAALRQLTKLVLATSTKIGSDAWPLIAALPSLQSCTLSHATIGAEPAPQLTYLKAALLLAERQEADIRLPVSLAAALPRLQQLQVHVVASHHDLARALHGHTALQALAVQQEALAVMLQHATGQPAQAVLQHAAQMMLLLTSITVQAVPAGGEEQVVIQQGQQQEEQHGDGAEQQPAGHAGQPGAEAQGEVDGEQQGVGQPGPLLPPGQQELVLGPQAPQALQGLLALAQFDLDLAQQQQAHQQAQLQLDAAGVPQQAGLPAGGEGQQAAALHPAAPGHHQPAAAAAAAEPGQQGEQQVEQSQAQQQRAYWPAQHYSSMPRLRKLELRGMASCSLDVVLADVAGCGALQELQLGGEQAGAGSPLPCVSAQGMQALAGGAAAAGLARLGISGCSMALEALVPLLGGGGAAAAGRLQELNVSEVLVPAPEQDPGAGVVEGLVRRLKGLGLAGDGGSRVRAPAGEDAAADIHQDSAALAVLLAEGEEDGEQQGKAGAGADAGVQQPQDPALTASERLACSLRVQAALQRHMRRYSGRVQSVEFVVREAGRQHARVELNLKMVEPGAERGDGAEVAVACVSSGEEA
jgi:hypothetical protein